MVLSKCVFSPITVSSQSLIYKMEKIQRVAETLNGIVPDESTPGWAKVLIGCVSELAEAVKSFNTLHDRLTKVEDISNVREQVIENLIKDNAMLKSELAIVRLAADSNEQKSRTQCLLIHGVDETQDENTDELCINIIKQEVGVEVSLSDIARSHRIGPKKTHSTRRTKSRAIIVRFSSIRKRMEVFRNKRNLKGKKTVITESLTSFRYDLFKKAQAIYGKMVWTSEGRIFTKINDKLVLISSEADLN